MPGRFSFVMIVSWLMTAWATSAEQIGENYLKKVVMELQNICNDILGLLDNFLIPKAYQAEIKAFYLQMKGDNLRYLTEVADRTSRDKLSREAFEAYQEGYKISNNLDVTHPVRLGLALNLSAFHYNIRNEPEKAVKLAKSAFDQAMAELDSLDDDEYKESTRILQLLQDNLVLWRSELDYQ